MSLIYKFRNKRRDPTKRKRAAGATSVEEPPIKKSKSEGMFDDTLAASEQQLLIKV